MKFIKIKKICLGTLAITTSLILSCNSLGMADEIDDYGENTIMPQSAISEIEPNNSSTSATDISNLTYRDAVTGFISSSSDVDYFKYKTSSKTGKIKISFSNPFDSHNYGVKIHQKSTDGTTAMCGNVNAVGDKTILLSVKPNTIYYIQIYSVNSKYTAITPYTLTVNSYSSGENVYGNLGWAYPLPSEYKTVTTHHGDPGYTSDGKPHNGIDLPADERTTIYNAADGVVKQAGDNKTMGNFVIVNTTCYEPNALSSSGSLTVRYLHMKEAPVFQAVKRFQEERSWAR